MSDQTQTLRIVAVALAALAALGFAAAAWNAPRTSRLAAGGRAEGTVVGFKRVDRTSHLVVRFDAPDGHSVRFRSEVSRPDGVERGDLVPVRYDPHDPSVAEVDSFAGLWGRVVIPAAIGLVLGMLATVIFLRVTVMGHRRRAGTRHRRPERRRVTS
jgi:hypothetical protein